MYLHVYCSECGLHVGKDRVHVLHLLQCWFPLHWCLYHRSSRAHKVVMWNMLHTTIITMAMHPGINSSLISNGTDSCKHSCYCCHAVAQQMKSEWINAWEWAMLQCRSITVMLLYVCMVSCAWLTLILRNGAEAIAPSATKTGKFNHRVAYWQPTWDNLHPSSITCIYNYILYRR